MYWSCKAGKTADIKILQSITTFIVKWYHIWNHKSIFGLSSFLFSFYMNSQHRSWERGKVLFLLVRMLVPSFFPFIFLFIFHNFFSNFLFYKIAVTVCVTKTLFLKFIHNTML
jgi:flagellar biosynthesis protein FlhB